MAPKPGEDCLGYASTWALGCGSLGVPIGFFRAHNELRFLPLAEKLQRWNNIKRTARILGNPMATFAACGLAYGAAECLTQEYLGREDSLTGIMGGIAVGVVAGLKKGSLASAMAIGGAMAGAVVVSDFLTKIVHPQFDDLAMIGKKADVKP